MSNAQRKFAPTGQRDHLGLRTRTYRMRVSPIAGFIILGVAILAFNLDTETGHAERGSPPALSYIQMFDATAGWAMAGRPQARSLLRTIDGGAHWKNVTPVRDAKGTTLLGPLQALTSSMAWVATRDEHEIQGMSRVFRTTDGGHSWRGVSIPAREVISMNFISAHDGWILSHEGVASGSQGVGIFHSVDGGVRWHQISHADSPAYGGPGTGLPFFGLKEGVSFFNATTGWITGHSNEANSAYFYSTRDGGRTWQHQSLIIPPNLLSPWTNGTQPPRFLGKREGIMTARFTNSQRMSIAVFYRTHDGGSTWKGGVPLHIDPLEVGDWTFVDADHGWVTDAARIYATRDGGQNWVEIPSTKPSKWILFINFISVQVGWALGGQPSFLLKTVDGGRTWMPVLYEVSSAP